MSHPATGLSPKTAAASVASAISLIIWTILSATVLEGVFDEPTIAALTGATATVTGFVLAYVVPDPARS